MSAPAGNNYAEGHGRPSKYEESFDNQAYKLCLLGATDKEIADFFEVVEATINNWKHEYPSFLASIRAGKTKADMEIANSLYERAKGYDYEEQMAFKVRKSIGKGISEESVEVVTIQKHAPPEPICIKYWLGNRQPDRWKEKAEKQISITENPANEKLDSLYDRLKPDE